MQLKTDIEENVKANLLIKPKANKDVLRFIFEMRAMEEPRELHKSALGYTFTHGYCYYFAHMLKTAFGRGEVCLAAPNDHMVWVDKNIAYDITGVCKLETDVYIPESYILQACPKHLDGFKHIPGKYDFTTDSEIANLITTYKEAKRAEK